MQRQGVEIQGCSSRGLGCRGAPRCRLSRGLTHAYFRQPEPRMPIFLHTQEANGVLDVPKVLSVYTASSARP